MAEVLDRLPVIDLARLADARRLMDERAAARSARELITGVVPRDHHVPRQHGTSRIRVREYSPPAGRPPYPCVLWMHGGGFVMGRPEWDDVTAAQIADRVGCKVFSVDWRWAPEHRYPAALDDCYASLNWLLSDARGLGIDPDRIAVAGASAGAGLAAALALRARDEGMRAICFQLLVFPMLDDRNTTPSSRRSIDSRLWHREANTLSWSAYLGAIAGTDRVDGYAAPARATDLHDLPPAFIAVGDLDLFVDEDIAYAQRLAQCDVPTELHVYSGAVHGFYSLTPASGLSRRFSRDRDDALRAAFGTKNYDTCRGSALS